MGQRDYSEATAAAIDEESHQLVQSAYAQVKQMLTEHKVTLEKIATELRRHETLDAKQLAQILVETGVSLAEVAPTPGAETLGAEVAGTAGAAALDAAPPNGGQALPGAGYMPGGAGIPQN
jgi:dsDNA-specific endonuclease/ATPase MutS2